MKVLQLVSSTRSRSQLKMVGNWTSEKIVRCEKLKWFCSKKMKHARSRSRSRSDNYNFFLQVGDVFFSCPMPTIIILIILTYSMYAEYVFVAGTDIILRSPALGSFRSELDFECMHTHWTLVLFPSKIWREQTYPLTAGWTGEKSSKISFSRNDLKDAESGIWTYALWDHWASRPVVVVVVFSSSSTANSIVLSTLQLWSQNLNTR